MENINWLVWAFCSLFFLATVNVFDNYFVEDVYADEYDGLAISALFNVFQATVILLIVWPMLADFFTIKPINQSIYLDFIEKLDYFRVFTGDYVISIDKRVICAFFGGVMLMLSYLSYFKVLFNLNDNVTLQILWTLATPMTMIFGHFIFSDKMTFIQYGGTVSILLGIAVLGFSGRFNFANGWKHYILWAFLMALLYSVQEIFTRYAYQGGEKGFFSYYLFFLLGQLAVGMASVVVCWKKFLAGWKVFSTKLKRFGGAFAFAEIFEQIASFCNQKAVDTTPTISLFGAMEGSMPVVVLLVGLGFFLVLSLPFVGKSEIGKKIWNNLKANLKQKLIATIFVVVGMYFLTIK